jgi:hypothetical protein
MYSCQLQGSTSNHAFPGAWYFDRDSRTIPARSKVLEEMDNSYCLVRSSFTFWSKKKKEEERADLTKSICYCLLDRISIIRIRLHVYPAMQIRRDLDGQFYCLRRTNFRRLPTDKSIYVIGLAYCNLNGQFVKLNPSKPRIFRLRH